MQRNGEDVWNNTYIVIEEVGVISDDRILLGQPINDKERPEHKHKYTCTCV